MRILLLLFVLALPLEGRSDSDIVVIVHPETPVQRLDRRQLRDVYLRKQIHWTDGRPINPLNLPASDFYRRVFFEEILGLSMAVAADYWLKMHYRGRQPPYVLASPQAVVVFVRRTPGAIGYVPGGIDVSGIRVVARFKVEP